MAKKPSKISGLPGLLVPRAEAEQRIGEQIEKGVAIRDRRINSGDQLDGAKAEKAHWTEYTAGMLKRMFDDATIAEDFSRVRKITVMSGSTTIFQMIDDFKEDISGAIECLQDVVRGLSQIPDKKSKPAEDAPAPPKKRADVLVVHGLDDISKEAVASLIGKLGLNPVILHEQPDAGRSILEKLESGPGIVFAAVILTPDELGTPRDTSRKLVPRERALQNVVFALGCLIGRLGRDKVCALHMERVEIPTGYDGVQYIKLDAAGAWGLKLAKALKKAGLDVDLNNAM